MKKLIKSKFEAISLNDAKQIKGGTTTKINVPESLSKEELQGEL